MVRLQDRSGTVRDTVYSLIIWRPISITAFSPTSVLPGDTVTVTGAGLENVDVFAFYQRIVISCDEPDKQNTDQPHCHRAVNRKHGANRSRQSVSIGRSLHATSLTVAPKVLVNRMNVSVTPPYLRLLATEQRFTRRRW